MLSNGTELDIVRHYVELIEKETKGSCHTDGVMLANLEDILHGEESTLGEALDRLLRATLSENVSLLGDYELPPMPRESSEGRSPEANVTSQLMNLVSDSQETQSVTNSAAQLLNRLSEDCMNASAENTDAGRGTVEVLKRKLSMLTAGIRLLHTQIEEKSLELFGSPDVELRVPSQVEALRDKSEELNADSSLCFPTDEVAPVSLAIAPATKERLRSASPKRRTDFLAQRRPPSVSRDTPSKSSRRSSSPQRGPTNRNSFGQQRHGQQPQSARGSFRCRRDLNVAPKVDCWSTCARNSSPRQRNDAKAQDSPPKERLALGARSRGANDIIEGRSVGLHAQAGRDSPSKPLRSPRGTPAEKCSPSHPVRAQPAAANGNARLTGGCSRQRSSSMSEVHVGSDNALIAGEMELPSHWQQLLSDAYRDVTGRPLVDRIRLLESSSASGRRADTPHVFWLHTMVRWGDMRIIGRDRVPERGEDLTLFVLHSHLQEFSQNKRHHNEQERDARMWNVVSVRVLNSLASVRGSGDCEKREMMGRLGAILLYDALGPMLAGDSHIRNECVPESMPREVKRTVCQGVTSQGDIATPKLVSPVLSPRPPQPPITVSPLLGSISVPAPLGSLQQVLGVSSPVGVLRNSFGSSTRQPIGFFGGSLTGSMTPSRQSSVPGVVSRQSSVAVPTLKFGEVGSKQPPPTAQVIPMPLSSRNSFGIGRGISDGMTTK